MTKKTIQEYLTEKTVNKPFTATEITRREDIQRAEGLTEINQGKYNVITSAYRPWDYPRPNFLDVQSYEGGDLDLSDYPNITHINLEPLPDEEKNKTMFRDYKIQGLWTPLTSLKFSNINTELEEIIIPNNDLKSIKFLEDVPNPDKVRKINVRGNPYKDTENKVLDRFKFADKVFNLPSQGAKLDNQAEVVKEQTQQVVNADDELIAQVEVMGK